MPKNAGVANFRVFFDELAAVIFQAPANLPVLYPVGSREEVPYIGGVGPEAVREGLRLGVPDGIAPKFYSQFLDDSLFHKNLSGGIVECHPVFFRLMRQKPLASR
jgi:hypothetical protein